MQRLAAGLTVLLATSSGLAEAGGHPGTKAIAERLFEEARTDLRVGRYREACLKLEESQRLDPGTGTLMNLALCHEFEDRIATAWAEYNEVAAVAKREGQIERAQLAAERAQALAPRLSYLVLNVDALAATRGLVVSLDGIPLGTAAWHTALPIDPGLHVITAHAPEREAVTQRFRVRGSAERITVSLPPLAPRRTSRRETSERLPGSPRRLHWQLGVGALGAGVLAAGAGTYFGLRANASWDERNRHCPSGRCDARAVEAWREARTSAALADAAFALSVIALGTGTYLVLLPFDAPSRSGSKRLPAASFGFGVGGAL